MAEERLTLIAIHERVMCLHPDDIISRMANKKEKLISFCRRL